MTTTLLMMASSAPLIVFLILLAILIAVLISNIRIVPQATAQVIERLGSYKTTWHTGMHFKLPFIETVAKKINLMEQVVDFPPQSVITKDNVRMQIDTVVFFQITDCKLYTYGVTNPLMAIENLTATTLRNIIGELDLDQTLTSRDIINTRMRTILDDATDSWGIKVTRVELKNIIPPKEIQEAMEKQMKAERERREIMLKAEGEKNSTILVAEGKKQQAILNAEAEKAAAILHAEAIKESKMREAEGEAEAILRINEATAAGIRMINEANPSSGMITLRSLETMTKMADGKATKIIIPSDLQGIMGAATAAMEAVTTKTPEA
jgi:regulator of protease activity HflC (stomatin/prohibitin superfamily)